MARRKSPCRLLFPPCASASSSFLCSCCPARRNSCLQIGMKGKTLVRAILDGAQEIAVPAFVSTLCICIVFVPVLMLSGAAKFLFTPLAMGVAFAMLTSYLLTRTVVPTLVHYMLQSEMGLD